MPAKALTYREVAELLNVSLASVYRWVKQGQIEPPVRLGALARFKVEAVQRVAEHGLHPVGTFRPPETRRAFAGRLGGVARARLAARAAKRPASKKGRGKAK